MVAGNKTGMKIKPLTADQKQYIRDNYLNMTRTQMSVNLGLSFKRVDTFCCAESLKKTKYISKEIRKLYEQPKSNIKRPPAVYSNMSREQHIDKWLNA